MSGKINADSMADMVQDFLRNAGLEADQTFPALCRKLLARQEEGSVCLPVTPEEEVAISASPFVACAPDDGRPFVFNPETKLLYVRRNWKYEQRIREKILQMAERGNADAFPVPDNGDYASLKVCQRRAIPIMAMRQFSILTGGPGTGKTYTIARAVKLLQAQSSEPLRIGLAAPTGKAAARVRETLGESGTLEAVTIHSLLGANYDFVTFKHNRNNPLPLDWLIVDEASMIDLPLMAKLLDALGENCKLTLVGDADQLSSVEPGRVFGDLCSMPELKDCIAELTESSRQKNVPNISRLAESVRCGEGDQAVELLRRASGAELLYCPLNPEKKQPEASLFQTNLLRCWKDFCEAKSPEVALQKLSACRVLCAVRRGSCGTMRLNDFIRKILPQDCPIPMMITRNDASLGVNNGDVGVIMPDDREHLYLRQGEIRSIPIVLLPALEMAFASTIHKSQGSEFDHVFIVLPPSRDPEGNLTGSLTRELLYTAITRAKMSVMLFAEEQAVLDCCTRKTRRDSGLCVPREGVL